MSRSDKRYSATGKYHAVVMELYEWGGRGPKRCAVKLATWITPREGAPYAAWDTGRLMTWDGELPPVGEPIELIAKHQCEIYNGSLKDEYAIVNFRTAPMPDSHASLPLYEDRAGGTQGGGGGGATAARRPQMPPGATPTQYGPPDHGAYDLRDDQEGNQAPPPTDDDRGTWGF
jgi:hypothetical protein